MSNSTFRRLMASAAVATGLFMAPTLAGAADLLPEPPIVEAPVVAPSGGWYLRGDITYDFHDIDTPTYSVPGGTVVEFDSAELDDAFDLGFGVGYQINENFRVDATGEYVFSSEFTGSTLGFCSAAAIAAGELNCASVDTSSYTAFKLLANAYIDLGNFSGFTPYVGAGIGGAYVTWEELTNTSNCTRMTVDCPHGGAGGYSGSAASSTATSTHDGESAWRFAWAMHTGFAYDIAQDVKLDLGYTYSRIEGGPMFSWLDDSGTQGYDGGINSHVLRAGLRYQIW